ncbi:MAG: transporter permease [Klenkia sp.]|nr:transporter permease [Klenkia sp.]
MATTRVRDGRSVAHPVMVVPLLTLLAVLFLAPLATVVIRSFTYPLDAPGGLGNYTRVLTDPIALQYAGNTFRTALVVAVLTVVIGYFYAYAMYKATPGWRIFLLFAALLPFWTSLLVRSFAWSVILRDTGIVNDLLVGTGIADAPIPLLRTSFAVTVGMTQILLPFVILPCFAAMGRVDKNLLSASRSLGAGPIGTFWRIFVPLTAPGTAAGAVLTFILAVGYYITPVLLGGPSDQPIAVLIENAVQQRGDWATAGALATLVLIIVIGLLAAGWGLLARAFLPGKDQR